MPLSRTFSAALTGIEAHLVEIEVNTAGRTANPAGGGGESIVSIVGLPDAAVRESRDRVRSALESSGFVFPKGVTVVNLAPADLRKEGAGFDLGIALGMLAANGLLDRAELARTGIIGELALNGQVRPVRGALPIAAMLSDLPAVERILVPEENAREAALAAARPIVYPVQSLADAVHLLQNGGEPFRVDLPEYLATLPANAPDFCEVKGQIQAKRALEIAAAGGHHLLMIGSPGCGKTMLATRLPGILPPMSRKEMLETSRIHSVLGLLSGKGDLMNVRPFRAPHHTASDIGIIGGGRDPRPGEISLAHNGVLFLDELPEFKRNVLEVLRQPLESGIIAVSRAAGSCVFPARFMLCSAMNPCPCGRGDVELGCTCSAMEKQRYRKKISGPILDRIDLHIELRQLSPEELLKAPDGESSRTIRERVIAARARQEARLAGTGLVCNAQMTGRHLQKFCRITPAGERLLHQAVLHFHLSPRAYDRILKVARTIADLAGSESIEDRHLMEAVSFRKTGLPDA